MGHCVEHGPYEMILSHCPACAKTPERARTKWLLPINAVVPKKDLDIALDLLAEIVRWDEQNPGYSPHDHIMEDVLALLRDHGRLPS